MGIFSEPKPETWTHKGHDIMCDHCKGNLFYRDKRLLNSAGATFLGFDWANKESLIFICANCKKIQWFALD